MSNLLNRFTVGVKIQAIAAILLVMLIIVASVSITQMGNIKDELHAVSGEDIPLTKSATNLATDQLELAVLFERALRVGAELEKHPNLMSEFKQVREEEEETSLSIGKEFKEIEHMLEAFIEESHDDEAITEFRSLLAQFKKIEKEHEEFTHTSKTILDNIEHSGHMPDEVAIVAIEESNDKIDHELELTVKEIEEFTEKAILSVEEHEASAVTMLWILGIISLLFGGSAAFFISRSLVVPIQGITDNLGSLANDELDIKVSEYPLNTELGKIAASTNSLRESLIEAVRMRKVAAEAEEEQRRLEAEKEAAEQQLMKERAEEAQKRSQETQQRADALDHRIKAFDDVIKDILNTVASATDEFAATANSLNNTATNTQTRVNGAAASTEEVTANIQTVAASAEELNSSIIELSRQAQTSSTISNEAAEEILATSTTLGSLAESANSIGQIIDMINDIAEQTNLLALNATIEAARAGDAGRGFAVVASEVKNLATQTAKATEEVTAQITQIQGDSASASTAMANIQKTVANIQDVSVSIAGAVEEQSAATGEISQNVNEVATATNDVSDAINSTSTAMEETSAGASQVLTASEDLAAQMAIMRTEVDSFITEIRAI